ncbi:MAG TPA: MtrAB system histidine kinase MtrB [Jatrophihabitantaceae bacterium]|jgi:two-component system sensor histidine kinase MtrB
MIEQAPAVPVEADASGRASGEGRARAPLPLAGIRERAGHWVRSIAVSVRQCGQTVARAWGRSLQLRVAVTTLVISGVVVLIVGIFLVDQISGGVLRAKRSAAIGQVDTAMASARAALADTNFADVQGVANGVSDLKSELALSSNDAGLYRVLIKSDVSDVQLEALADVFDSDPVPPGLQRLVEQGKPAVQYARIRASRGGPMVPGLVVGQSVQAQGGMYEIYYLFPLNVEQDTIALVQRTVLLAGLGLVLFVAMIAMLVTRQVVRPVRVAARTAARVAGGDLSQRIRVSGSDDIARLGQSFNEMAGSLQRQIQRLEQLSRLQRRFTSDVSHELRTPLTTIRMASEVLYTRRGDFSPQVARSAELLQAELDRFEGLLADLLEISRYDAGVAHLEAEDSDLGSVAARVVDSQRLLASRHGSEIVTRMPDEPVPVEIDARRVERILRNLIGNALEYGEGRPVVVTVAADAASAAVTVRDHGVGLRPGEVGLVFNRFWRGDPSRSRLTGGTGLGLAISLEDARLHGGWLQAWGERGSGSQFRLTLPRRVGEALSSSPLPLEPADAVESRS